MNLLNVRVIKEGNKDLKVINKLIQNYLSNCLFNNRVYATLLIKKL